MIMAPTLYRCQQFPFVRCCSARQLIGMAVLISGCLGCWQEVRYEPGKSAPSDPESPASSEPPQESPVSERVSAALPELILPRPDDEVAAAMPAEAEASPAQPTDARTALATWQMSSKWSMAAALQAKGRDSDSYGERLRQAESAAQLLGVSLTELPSHAAGADRLAENLTFLLETAGPRLASDLSERHGADHAALAELATKTHVLLLSYSPTSTRLEPVIASIHRAALQSELPESVWRELVDLLTARADFAEVKAAIYQLHTRAVAYLSGAAAP